MKNYSIDGFGNNFIIALLLFVTFFLRKSKIRTAFVVDPFSLISCGGIEKVNKIFFAPQVKTSGNSKKTRSRMKSLLPNFVHGF